MFPHSLCLYLKMSNISGDGGGSFSSGNTGGVLEEGQQRQTSIVNSHSTSTAADVGSTPQELLPDSSKKKKRSLPGTPGKLKFLNFAIPFC